MALLMELWRPCINRFGPTTKRICGLRRPLRLVSSRAAKVFDFPLAIPGGILAVICVGRIMHELKSGLIENRETKSAKTKTQTNQTKI